MMRDPHLPSERREPYATDRLVGSRLWQTDFSTLSVLHHDPRVMATLGGVRSDEETRRFLAEKLAHWEMHGFGMCMFHDRITGDFVGRGGLQHIEVTGVDEVEVGYTVRAEFFGQGYATEMARELVRVGFEDLGLTNLVAFTLPENIASRRVMEKAGFTFERRIEHAGYAQVLYRICR